MICFTHLNHHFMLCPYKFVKMVPLPINQEKCAVVLSSNTKFLFLFFDNFHILT